jgi:biopolymer transport protein ExbB/TolQ
MDTFMKILVDFKVIDFIIGAMGAFGLALIIERFRALYFSYSLKAEAFMAKVMRLVEDDNVEEAIALCGASGKKPLAIVVKRILERSDREDSAIEASLDIAASEVAPRLSRNLGYLQMVSNVVTLIGLLGTVIGLIMSFRAVSFADPSQKQTLLADGISMAMHSTAAGLCVAIPVMVFYSFLHARQGKLFSEIDLWSGKLIEQLRGRGFAGLGASAAFPAVVSYAAEAKGKNGAARAKSV